MTTHPNRVCPCGYKRFRERKISTATPVARWVLYDTTAVTGLGITPFGTYFGAGTGGAWGLFTASAKTTRLETTCESCQRIRSSKALGGAAVFGSYVANGYFYVVASDAADAACFSLRFSSGGSVFTIPLSLSADIPAPIAVNEAPAVTAETPDGPTASILFRARVPEVDVTAPYLVELVDSCCGCSTPLVTLTLESPAMILTPLSADLGGAPEEWLFGQRGLLPSAQVGTGSRLSIPFDKVKAVHEYNPRLGTLPSSQGWVHTGSGSPSDFALIEGGVLKELTTLDSVWVATTVLGSPTNQVYAYLRLNSINDTAPISKEDGFEIRAKYSLGVGDDYRGVRCNYTDQWRATLLSGANDSTIGVRPAAGWMSLAAFDDNDTKREQAWLNGGAISLPANTFNDANPTAAAVDVVTSFGDNSGTGTDVLVGGVVASYGGRFIRPTFSAFAPVTDPVIRLYTASDINVSVTKTARFMIRYGTALSDPYGVPSGAESVTVNYVVAGSMVETQIQLSGLTAGKPFWFSIERVWDHGTDLLDATVHFFFASVRSA